MACYRFLVCCHVSPYYVPSSRGYAYSVGLSRVVSTHDPRNVYYIGPTTLPPPNEVELGRTASFGPAWPQAPVFGFLKPQVVNRGLALARLLGPGRRGFCM